MVNSVSLLLERGCIKHKNIIPLCAIKQSQATLTVTANWYDKDGYCLASVSAWMIHCVRAKWVTSLQALAQLTQYVRNDYAKIALRSS